MNMKKIASVVLALALSVSVFAACGSNGNSSASSTASTESSTASTDSSTASTDSSAASTDSSAAATGDKIDVLNQSETMDVSPHLTAAFRRNLRKSTTLSSNSLFSRVGLTASPRSPC